MWTLQAESPNYNSYFVCDILQHCMIFGITSFSKFDPNNLNVVSNIRRGWAIWIVLRNAGSFSVRLLCFQLVILSPFLLSC